MSEKPVVVVKAGETHGAGALDIFGDRVLLKLTGKDTHGGFAVVVDQTQPKDGPPLHRHSREDEFFHVLEGEYLFEVDGRRITAGKGGSVCAPCGTTHTFHNLGAEPGELLIVVQPAGLEDFFIELSAATTKMTEPDMDVIVSIFEKHGMEVMGPPLGAHP
jgi:quercetin dioxygenase-like cupin family protein